MQNIQLHPRISFNPKVMGGQACVRGMRIPVSLVLNFLANGMDTEQILREYPDLEAADIRACLEYAEWLAKDEFHTIKG